MDQIALKSPAPRGIAGGRGSGSEEASMRREWAVIVILITLLTMAAVVAATAFAADTRRPIDAVAAVGMTVADMERSVAFYTGVLGFERVSDVEVWGPDWERLEGVFGLRMRVVRLRLGDESLELAEYLTPRGQPVPADSRSNDRWFQHVAIVVSDMEKAYARLRANRVQHSSPAPQRLPDWNPAAGGIEAFYFKDPDGHPLEVIHFPPGKGDPRWQRPGDRLFLGIDHTAIVVADTDTSLRCYRDTLGLRVVGESENYGPEQERLNNVFGAHLRITALRASSGPGVEFLEYLAPRDGRVAPADARPNDLAHWHTVLVSADAEAAVRAVRGGACAKLAPSVVAPEQRTLGFAKGFLARDPDGHAFRVVEP
jgi:catechol 2,3-dioxygenase-like lactoylglutathione lyase family enzyme